MRAAAQREKADADPHASGAVGAFAAENKSGALSAGSHWLVCHTRPRREKKFAAMLTAAGIGHYLPLIESVRHYAGAGSKRFTRPLFPGYVFAQAAPAGRARLYEQQLVARVIPVEDERSFLRQLQDVRHIVESGLALSLHPLLTRGRRVRVVGGSLNGLEGVVDDPEKPTGIVIAVDVLRQGLLVRVPLEWLQPLP